MAWPNRRMNQYTMPTELRLEVRRKEEAVKNVKKEEKKTAGL